MALIAILEPLDEDDDDLCTCAECEGKFAETNEHRLCEECEDEYRREWGGFNAQREWGTL